MIRIVFQCLISLLEMDIIIVCELRGQGGGGGDVIISEMGKPHVVK